MTSSGLLFGVQCHRVEASVGQPEGAVEALRKVDCFFLQAIRGLYVAEAAQQGSHAVLRVVHVTLNFTERDGRLGNGTVTMNVGVPRVFPPLIDEPL